MNEFFATVWNIIEGRLLVLALLTALDLVFGVIVSFIQKEFKWECLYHYLDTDVLPIFAWIGVVLITNIPAELIPIGFTIPIVADVVYATVFLSILGSLVGSFGKLGVLKEELSRAGFNTDNSEESDE